MNDLYQGTEMINISTLKELPVEYLTRGRYQPRRIFNEVILQELAESIRSQGVIEPIIVREISHNHYEIIAGERRWRASQLVGLRTVPCVIRDYTDAQAAEVTLIENIQREDLNPIEEAEALSRLIEDFQYTHDEVAKTVGQSRAKITNTLRLLQLHVRVQHMLIEKELSGGHGKILAGLPTDSQLVFAQKAIEESWSVRQLEMKIQREKTLHSPVTSGVDANIRRLEKITSDHFGAPVVVENNSSTESGWIKFNYQDYDVLAGILEKMGVDSDQ